MIAKTLEINWHDGNALYSADFSRDGTRFATAGADGSVRIWGMEKREEQINTKKGVEMLPVRIDFMSELRRHSSAVNVVRFSPSGDLLASAGDDTCIILWRLSDQKDLAFGSDHAEFEKESWSVVHMFYGHNKEIYDLSWSPCGQYFITASIDNTARVWSVAEKKSIHVFSDHVHYVQGVAWDPKQQFVATQSSDRSMAIYRYRKENGRLHFGPCARRHVRLDKTKLDGTDNAGSFRLYHDENLVSFFRRLSFSPDGALLVTPAGLYKDTSAPAEASSNEDMSEYCSYLYPRNALLKHPIACMGGYAKPATLVRWCPQRYECRTGQRSLFAMPYRLVYAVATQDTVYVYDTQQAKPLCSIAGMHFAPITDMTWSSDGSVLAFASADGYCSAVVFDERELGTPYTAAAEVPDDVEMTEEPQETPSTPLPTRPVVVVSLTTNNNNNNNNSTSSTNHHNVLPKRRITPQLISAPAPNLPVQEKAKKRRVTPTLVTPHQ